MDAEREFIHDQLREQIPELKRRKATPRVLAATDILLDQLLELDQTAPTGGQWDDMGRY